MKLLRHRSKNLKNLSHQKAVKSQSQYLLYYKSEWSSITTGDGVPEKKLQEFHDEEYTNWYSWACISYRVDELSDFPEVIKDFIKHTNTTQEHS